jgi:hypothetical protein
MGLGLGRRSSCKEIKVVVKSGVEISRSLKRKGIADPAGVFMVLVIML